MLLRLIRWLRAETNIEPEIVLLTGGALEPAFRELGRTTVLDPNGRSSFSQRLETALESIGLVRSAGRLRGIRYRFRLRRAKQAEVVYLNSCASFGIARYLPRGPRLVAHVHELEMGLRRGIPRSLVWSRFVAEVHLFIAVADCVAENLAANWAVPRQKIRTHHGFIDVTELASTKPVSLPASNGRAVVGGCGTLKWSKGADLFVHVAAEVCRRRSDIDFVWLGGAVSELDRWNVEYEIRAFGITDRVHLIDEKPDAISYLSAFDVLALTGREDPFSLVALEASAVGTSVVAFDNGGVREWITPSCGRLVPYRDVEAMTDALVELVDDADSRAALGAAATEIVSARYDVTAVAPRLWADVAAC